jgi:threonine dehydratase
MPDNATPLDVELAAERLRGVAHRTPVLQSSIINELVGADVYFKCENFQRCGAFKFRGAYNTLSQFTPEQRRTGVVAYSGGNHAQGIALSARILDMPATIVMPSDSPTAKIAATREYGATIVHYDRATESREAIAADIAATSGATVVPSFDHPHVIAGQGTVAKELFEEVGTLDTVFVPVGGGGLLAGTLLAAENSSPSTDVYGVEPESGNDAQQSLQKGEIVRIPTPPTIADGASTSFIGDYTFEIMRDRVRGILTATDDELVNALKLFCTYMKIVVEPTGCLGLAAALSSKNLVEGRRIGIIVSGGNVDLDRLGRLLAGS